MKVERVAAIVGVGESDLGVPPGRNVLQIQAQAAKRALEDAVLMKDDVDVLFAAGNWTNFPSSMLSEYLEIQPKYIDGTNVSVSSFESHVAHATAGIKAGLFEVSLITYGSVNRSSRFRPQPPLRL